MKMENIEQNQDVKWCPGADLNHRHEDFQSTALPLSYPGTGKVSYLGSSGFRIAAGHCPVTFAKKAP